MHQQTIPFKKVGKAPVNDETDATLPTGKKRPKEKPQAKSSQSFTYRGKREDSHPITLRGPKPILTRQKFQEIRERLPPKLNTASPDMKKRKAPEPELKAENSKKSNQGRQN